MSSTKLQFSHSYKFPADTLFDAFLHPESLGQFMFRTDDGILEISEVDGEPGGSFTITENRKGKSAAHYGTFVEIDRPERLSFVFSVEKDSADSTFIEIEFTNKSGAADIKLTHEVPAEQSAYIDLIKKGWTLMLENLDSYLTQRQASAGKAQPKDSNGQILSEGDSVKTIKDLKVKGSSMMVKRGTIVKKVHLISGNDEEVDCKVDGIALALETQWLVKV